MSADATYIENGHKFERTEDSDSNHNFLTFNAKTKVRPSYDPSCAIFSSFNSMVISNIASGDIGESRLMLY